MSKNQKSNTVVSESTQRMAFLKRGDEEVKQSPEVQLHDQRQETGELDESSQEVPPDTASFTIAGSGQSQMGSGKTRNLVQKSDMISETTAHSGRPASQTGGTSTIEEAKDESSLKVSETNM